jgi:hypothetical protein
MVLRKKISIIEILWRGPHRWEELAQFDNLVDRGVYQIYGPHEVYGSDSDTLLYLGKASKQSFRARINQHTWLSKGDGVNLFGELRMYLGRLGGAQDVSQQEWETLIDTAERLLIYYSNPFYNTAGHEYSSVEKITNTIVINLGKKNFLPSAISSLPDESDAWIGDNLVENDAWKFFQGQAKD